MSLEKIWLNSDIPDNEVERITTEAEISPLLARVFLARGVTDAAYIKSFLKPSLSDLHDPFLLKDMDIAVELITSAIKSNCKITIYGDYDVDGITSTSVLYDFLACQGACVDYYIPDRLDEGYGLSISALEKILDSGTSLVITVDCGITAVEEVNYINERNAQIVITDHHECKEMLPDAGAIINPCRQDSLYPFKELAGVGVTFKLINALCIKMGLGKLYLKYIDLVAVGTVADVVPLTGENRILVGQGLLNIENTVNLGLKVMIENSGLKDKPVNSWGIGFVIAPRINAAGRIGDARRGVRLFTTRDEAEALAIALELNEDNKCRQETEYEIYQQVVEKVEAQFDLSKDRVIVVAGEDWHHGVIGIVASKITEKYYRPCILISCEDGIGKGSGRSIEGLNLFKALTHCEGLLEKFGGHELAAGLTLKEENIPLLKEKINKYADEMMKEKDLVPRIKIDAILNRSDLSIDRVRELDLLSPFGAGNPSPVFMYNNLKISDIKTVGENKHLKLKLLDSRTCIEAIGFNMGRLKEEYAGEDILDVVCSLEINSWNSVDRIQLNLKDIRLCKNVTDRNNYFYSLDKCIEFSSLNAYNRDNGLLNGIKELQINELVPERQELAAVYKHMKAAGVGWVQIEDLFLLAKSIESSKFSMNYFKLKKSIEIFEELGLLEKKAVGNIGMAIRVFDIKEKTDLESSTLYKKLQWLKTQI